MCLIQAPVEIPKDQTNFRPRIRKAKLLPRPKDPKQFLDRIIELIHDPLFEWNNGIVSDGNMFRANFSTTLGDIAITNTVGFLQIS